MVDVNAAKALRAHHVESELKFPSVAETALAVVERVIHDAGAVGYGEMEVLAVRCGLEEAVINAVKHGNRADPLKSVRVAYRISPEEVWLQVEDEGEGFEISAIPDPTDPENLLKPSGRGMLMMRHFMGEVQFNEIGNCVTMRRRKT